jgi:hypothetical protein
MGRHRTSPGTTTLRLLGPGPRSRPHTPVALQPRAPPRRAAAGRNPRRRRARSAPSPRHAQPHFPLLRTERAAGGEGTSKPARSPTTRFGGPPSSPPRAKEARNHSLLGGPTLDPPTPGPRLRVTALRSVPDTPVPTPRAPAGFPPQAVPALCGGRPGCPGSSPPSGGWGRSTSSTDPGPRR